MKTLICGSLAYDTIMVFGDRFQNHILPEKIHILSVAFLVPEMRREYGGTAGNIAYNLKLLEGEPLIMSTVGHDFADYRQRLNALEIPQTYIREVADAFTAQAFITTDLDDNQITAFHPGAMSYAHLNQVSEAHDAQFGIIAPDGREGMLLHARQFHEAGIPFLFDPGQGLPMFSGPEVLEFLDLASYFAVNDYEAQLMSEKTGLSFEQLAGRVKAAVITRGAEGSRIHAEGSVIHIPAVRPDRIADPTGCGDAYRAGLIYGISKGWAWAQTGRLASLMGAIKIAHRGGQNHRLTRAEISSRYEQAFGIPLDS
jgi:adenosine kinase